MRYLPTVNSVALRYHEYTTYSGRLSMSGGLSQCREAEFVADFWAVIDAYVFVAAWFLGGFFAQSSPLVLAWPVMSGVSH